MTTPLTAARVRPAVFLLLATGTLACGCRRDAAPAERPGAPPRVADVRPGTDRRPALPPPRALDTPSTAPASPVDPAAMVFDTVAPPRPAPRPDVPAPRPSAPRPTAQRPPAPPTPDRPPDRPAGPDASAASCDVRPAEGYCFAYTGPAWSASSAAANCASAPGATFRAAPCPTAGRIATCTFRRASDPDRELVYTTYAPAGADLRSALDLARLACPGTFEVAD